jgi:hypothetical protein
MTAHQNLGDTSHLRELFQRRLRQIQLMQAGDLPASHANEMRMLPPVLVVGISKFESPDVVAQFGTRDQPRLGQVIQIAKNGRFVEPQRYQISACVAGAFDFCSHCNTAVRAAVLRSPAFASVSRVWAINSMSCLRAITTTRGLLSLKPHVWYTSSRN